MKISVLLPFKENYSPDYAGAVSLFINDTIKLSKFKNQQPFMVSQITNQDLKAIIQISKYQKNLFKLK